MRKFKNKEDQSPFPTVPVVLLCMSALTVLCGAVLSFLGLHLVFTTSTGYIMFTIGAVLVTLGTVVLAASGKSVIHWVVE